MTKDEAMRQAITVLSGCLEHPDADDAIAALQESLAQDHSFAELVRENYRAELLAGVGSGEWVEDAAMLETVELRRLHEVNAELVKALKALCVDFIHDEARINIARAALAKCRRTTMIDKELLELAAKHMKARLAEEYARGLEAGMSI